MLQEMVKKGIEKKIRMMQKNGVREFLDQKDKKYLSQNFLPRTLYKRPISVKTCSL